MNKRKRDASSEDESEEEGKEQAEKGAEDESHDESEDEAEEELEAASANESEEKPEDEIPIVSEGDLILVVGKQKQQIRVHSLIIQNASHALAHILDPYSRELLELKANGEGTIEIALPEDSYSVMLWICKVLHGQFVPNKISSPNSLYAIACGVEKYDLSDSMALAMEVWINKISDTASFCGTWKLLVCSHMLDMPDSFEQLTRLMVLKMQDNFMFSDVLKLTPGFADGPKLASILSDFARQVRWSINIVLSDQGLCHIVDNNAPRMVAAKYMAKFNKKIESSHGIDKEYDAFHNNFGKLVSISQVDRAVDYYTESLHGDRDVTYYTYISTCRELKSELDTLRGLCLPCFNEGKIKFTGDDWDWHKCACE